ncbi:m7GpppX diphosphatase [Teleopsis dalmanni]|uniref:m7GpppX diphosphatase n=1 Tax=Teleopsis dalmanni TaxID=139649 RepID=UPI000D32B543|nr:m7GpppX diphosphatase [Teleopsis dalmanni]
MIEETVSINVNEKISTKETIQDDVKNSSVSELKDDKEVKSPQYNLQKFKLTRILQNNTVRKSIALLGTFPDLSESDQAIVLFEKEVFREKDVQTEATNDEIATKGAEEKKAAKKLTYFNDDLQVKTEFINNIYGSFQCVASSELNGLKTTVVYPATEKHIEKYSINLKYVVTETPELYKNITLPFLESSQFSLEWVYNILEHKQETERIIFEDKDPDEGFILLPDLKWDGRNVETLYLIALPHKRNIKSLRDLTGEHLPLLRNIRKLAVEKIEELYGISGSQLRMYFHYQPSFYHLHVHINLLRNDAPGIWCEKSHMLDTVINNLELVPDYYSRATIPFVLYSGNKLLDQYSDTLKLCSSKRKSLENTDVETKRQKLSDN